MSSNTPEHLPIPARLTNMTHLRILCLQAHGREPDAVFSSEELAVIGNLMSEHAGVLARSRRLANDDWRDNAGLVILNRDLDEFPVQMPKWSALASWLTPESVAGSAPELIEQIAKLALSRQLHLHRVKGR